MPMIRAGLITAWITTILAAAGGSFEAMAAQPTAPVAATDGQRKQAPKAPLERIISLAPALTDIVFDLGAERRLVGAISYEEHPPGARHILTVGSVAGLNYERILKLKPQLVLAWLGGTPSGWIKRLRELGVPVYISKTETLNDISDTVSQIAGLIGANAPANASPIVMGFNERLTDLRQTYADREPISVFYQVWAKPLMSLNRQHIIADAIRSCGGQNVFASANTLVPRINIEAVIAKQPQVVATAIKGGPAANKKNGLEQWAGFADLPAIANNNLVILDADQITRPTTRILDAVEQLCKGIDRAR